MCLFVSCKTPILDYFFLVMIKKYMIKCQSAGCFASKPGKPKTPEQTIRKKLMPVLLYLTFLSKRMWNVADEVIPTPDCTHLLFYFIFCTLVSHPWPRVRMRKKKKRLSTWGRGHRWHWTNGDVSQVALKNRGLVLAVAICGDKFCAVAAKYGQTVAAVDSWSSQRPDNPREFH